MTRIMYDSVTIGAIPPTAQLVGCYVDGRYANVKQARQRFPRATIVTITVTGIPMAHVCDCETGDLTPPHAAQWAAREHQAGRHPTIYCNASTWPAVQHEVAKTELKPGDVSYWIAQYDNQPHIPAGAVAKQYIDHGPHGENVDLSVVADYWPGVDSTPPPHPAPSTPAWYHRVLRAQTPMLHGDDVTVVQRKVGLTGHNLDGWYGPSTAAAVEQWQRAHKLSVDGVIGPATARAIG